MTNTRFEVTRVDPQNTDSLETALNDVASRDGVEIADWQLAEARHGGSLNLVIEIREDDS